MVLNDFPKIKEFMKVILVIMVFLAGMLVLGCISLGNRTNESNVTSNVTNNVTNNITNQTANQTKDWVRYTAKSFSFEYPANTMIQEGSGLFMAQSSIGAGTTGEVLVVTYINTSAVYGQNKDKIFRENPTKTASDFLIEDKEDDPAKFLDGASEVGQITTFSLGRDTYIAEVPFKTKFSGFQSTYDGYALDMYVPERSLHVKVRILAIDPIKSKNLRDQFLLSFRIE